MNHKLDNVFITYRIITRFSVFLWPILPYLIALSIFFPTEILSSRIPIKGGWETPSFGMYHILCLLYLLTSSLHQMILSYRTTAFDNLVSDPYIDRLVPGVVISTDKKFSVFNVVVCFLIGLSNILISLIQILYVENTTLYKILFMAVFLSSSLVITSEMMMTIFIYNNLQSALVSEDIGIEVENTLQPNPRACRYLFSVVDHNIHL